jgi:LmbE family N-acetylglucosaminyl deacetylase
MRILHLSPHPDDELLGAPATLIALAQAGHEVVNYAVSLGRPEDAARRERELRDACARAGFALRVADPPLAIGHHDHGAAARARLIQALVTLVAREPCELLVAPSPHDGHHAHELVGRAAVTVAAAQRVPLWIWGLWSDLPIPTLLHGFGEAQLERIIDALSAHGGELARNDYRRLLRGRAQATAISGPERVFGFGSPGGLDPYAEVTCEVVPSTGGTLMLGSARRLDPAAPLAVPTRTDVSSWLRAPSPRSQLGR